MTDTNLMSIRLPRRFRSVVVVSTMLSAVLYSGCTHGSPRTIQPTPSTQSHSAKASVTSVNPLHDPELITGTLPSGLRYYIRSNHFPAKRANIWLAVNAGSINEDNDQLGFAHFLEHMAFNGTKHFPGNAVIDFVEQSGMTFGSDLNAYTSFEETVYQLTIPTDDKSLFNGGLQIIDDWVSGRILMDSSEVVAERGVVLGEWRARLPDTASKRFQMDGLSRTYGESSLFAKHFPIGDPELLKTATAEPILRFYRDWYRPDLMAVIAVGDFDAKAVEKEILKRFGKLQPPTNARKFGHPVVTASSQTIVHSLIDKIWPNIEFEWPASPLSDDPLLALKQQLIDQITLPYLQRTFNALSKKEHRAFADARIGREPGITKRSHDRLVLHLVATPDTLMPGFQIALTEVERVAQHGISNEVLGREKQALLREYEAWADGSASISSSSYAQRYTQHYLTGEGNLLGPAQALELVRSILPTISSNDIAREMQGWRNQAGRIVTVFQPQFAPVPKIPDSEVKELLASIAASSLSTASLADGLLGSPNAVASIKGSLLSSPPPIGNVVSTTSFAASDITVWNLSNGARVVYKKSENQPDDITIEAYSLGGHSLLPDSLYASPARLVGMLMTASGGFNNTDHEALERQARTTGLREFQVSLNAFDEEIVVGGSPRELEYLFQMMYLQFTAPKVDTLALDDWRRNGFRTMYMSMNDRYAANHGMGNRRLKGLTPVSVPFLNLEQAMRVYQDRFGDASDFTFYIVGPEKSVDILPFVNQYIASLPSTNRKVREVPRDFKIPVLNQKLQRPGVGYYLPPERAGMSLMFVGAVPHDTTEYLAASEDLSAASWILGRRLRNELREKMGVTYNASAPYDQYWTPDPRYVVAINVTTDPQALDTTVDAVLNEIEKFRKEGPSDEELSMIRNVRTRQLENASQSNKWWIGKFEVFDRLGISYDHLNSGKESPLTKERIQAAAKKYFPEDTYILNAQKPYKKKTVAGEDKGKDDGEDVPKGDTKDEGKNGVKNWLRSNLF